MEEYVVYARADTAGYIVDINSSAFLPGVDGWAEIARGAGDRYHHAQGNYLPGPIQTDGGAYRYKLADGQIVACNAEEIAAQEAAILAAAPPTYAELEAQNAELVEAMAAMVEDVYNQDVAEIEGE